MWGRWKENNHKRIVKWSEVKSRYHEMKNSQNQWTESISNCKKRKVGKKDEQERGRTGRTERLCF